jgi:hypothetical protein
MSALRRSAVTDEFLGIWADGALSDVPGRFCCGDVWGEGGSVNVPVLEECSLSEFVWDQTFTNFLSLEM